MKYTVMYAHLKSINVKAGDLVNAKVPWKNATLIGIMGDTGLSTAAHLHLSVIEGLRFELWKLIQMYNGDLTPSKEELDFFMSENDPTLFGVAPYITVEWDDQWYIDNRNKRHLAKDGVPINRKVTDLNFTIYWNRTFGGRVLKTGYDSAYGNYVLIGYDDMKGEEWINYEVIDNDVDISSSYGQSEMFDGKVRYIKVHPSNFKIVNKTGVVEDTGYAGVNGSFFNPDTMKATSILRIGDNIICNFGNDGVYKQGTLMQYANGEFDLFKIRYATELNDVVFAIGGIELVRDGEITYDRNADNFSPPYNDVHRTTTQTSIGYTYDGYILLARHWYSNRLETASHMKLLGCKYAIGLDGGGSTQYVVPDKNQTRTSSRRVANQLVALDLPL